MHNKIGYTLAGITLTSLLLAGCGVNNQLKENEQQAKQQAKQHRQTNQQQRIKALQKLAKEKQMLTEKLWSLQNTKTMALNRSNLKTLGQIKTSLFETQNQLTVATNKMTLLNKVLRQRYHHAVLDNGQLINTWTLLKTDDEKSNHQRAHLLINKLRKLQTQQMQINERLWDDQNRLTIALNHNQNDQLKAIKAQYFKDREAALPIANQIDMLTTQINKFMTGLQKPTTNIHSNQTLDDWVVFQTIANNNQKLNQNITPSNPNDDVNSTRANEEADDATHPTNATDATDEAHTTTDTDTAHTTTETGGEVSAGHAGAE